MRTITLRLVAEEAPDKPLVERAKQSSDVNAMRIVFDHIQENLPIRGFGGRMRGDGTITYTAQRDQLTPDVVETVQNAFEDALRQI